MIDVKASWDALSETLLYRLRNEFDHRLNVLLRDLADDFGEAGVAFIKPQVRGNNYWQWSTGATERGIDYDVDRNGGGYTVNYLGNNTSDDGKHNIAHLIDVGNFPSNSVIFRTNRKPFPISARVGEVFLFPMSIHGMGHVSKDFPRNFSEKAMDDLAKRAPDIAEDALDDFINRLVT